MSSERQAMIELIQQANSDGASLVKACAEAGICLRTYRRWYRDGAVQDDRRPTAVRSAPANKLSAAEQEQIVELCSSPAYSQLPPSQIVPDLLDKGIYIASESTFSPWAVAGTQAQSRANNPSSQRPLRSLVLGYHLLPLDCPWPVLLPVYVRGSLQPQDRRLRSP